MKVRFTTGSAVHALQVVDTTRLLRECGVKPGAKPVRSYGIEAFYPKIAFPLPLLVPHLAAQGPRLPMSAYFGAVAHFAVRYLWAYAKDCRAGLDPIADGGYPSTGLIAQGEQRLADQVNRNQGKLEPFISRFKSGGNLAVELARDDSALTELKSLVNAGIDLMFPRATDDTRFTKTERTVLSAAPRFTLAQQSTLFNRWRDLHFEKNVAAAIDRRVRYIGLGIEHVAHLVRRKAVGADTHVYDMRLIARSGDDLDFPELDDPKIVTLKSMMARSENSA